MFDRFGIDFGAVLGAPLSCVNRLVGGPRRSWDRLGSVLSSSCGLGSLFLSFLSSCWGRLGSLLVSFWEIWAILGSLGSMLGRLGLS